MQNELWNVIKSLSSNESISSSELALAEQQLNVDLFEVLKDHFKSGIEGIQRATPPWM